ncbi:MAG: pyridoxamine 5'-phosphate oxidase family protein [Anaerolineae bacterium]
MSIPPDIETVFTEFRTAELTTLAKDGTPITWPVTLLYKREQGQFFAATSAGLAAKCLNIRRDPRVSLLFSEPAGSGLTQPPAVLVQGIGSAPDVIIHQGEKAIYDDLYRLSTIVFQRQKSDLSLPKFLMHRLLDWYYIRLPIYITIQRIHWWPNMDFSQPPQHMEAAHVG